MSTTSDTLREDHILADGTRVTLRFIQPDDAAELRRAFGRLSSRSRYQRFFALMPDLTDDMIRYLTRVDGDKHLAIVATTDSLDLKSEIGLGVARYVRLDGEPEVAEAAVTVTDDAQGKGIGRLLVRALARAARARGVHSFRGTVLSENVGMRHLLTEVGAKLYPVTMGGDPPYPPAQPGDGQTLVFDVALDWPPEKDAEHPLRRLLRAAAESLGLMPHGEVKPSPSESPAGEG